MGKEADGDGGSVGEALADLEAKGVEVAHVGFFDMEGAFRERRLRLSALPEVFGGGGTFVNVLPQWDIADVVFGQGPFVGEPVAIDPGSARPFPFEDKAVFLVADYEGASAALSPRKLLERQIERAAALGYEVQAGFEFEFIVLEETAASLREKSFRDLVPFAPDNACWSGQSAAVRADFVRDLESTLTAAGVSLFSLGVELGPGCFEATLAAGDPLRAADDAAFFKLVTKAFCRRRGLTAAFMAKLADGFPGLSGHLQLSLRERESGRLLFGRGEGPQGLSPTMAHCIGGLVEQLPDMIALCSHSANAYRRMLPGNWAPRTATWAEQQYTVALRAVLEPAARSRVEFRIPAADTNPFLALAMALGAGLWGIENQMAPPPPAVDAADTAPTATRPALPRDLTEAAARLEQSAVARALFGERFIDHFVASRRHEDAALRGHVSAFERTRYLEMI